MAELKLNIFNEKALKAVQHLRKGEHRLGQKIKLLENDLDELSTLSKKGVRFAILGVPESIGPMGNGGLGGAENGYEAFLKSFVNVQSNRFLDGKEVVLIGHVELTDLQQQADELDKTSDYFLQKLHLLCEAVDERVEVVVSQIARHGLTPIVIGGGHNNSLPIISGIASHLGKLNVLNIDAHADYRSLEGRHSGNGFSYAVQRQVLNKYAVFGLHQNYNGEHMLKAMDASGMVKSTFMEDIQYADKQLLDSIEFLEGEEKMGLEIDMDAIRYMPSSAISPSGFSLEQMRYFLRKVSQAMHPCYLHLAEAAPSNEDEQKLVGKALSYLVTDFIKNA